MLRHASRTLVGAASRAVSQLPAASSSFARPSVRAFARAARPKVAAADAGVEDDKVNN